MSSGRTPRPFTALLLFPEISTFSFALLNESVVATVPAALYFVIVP